MTKVEYVATILAETCESDSYLIFDDSWVCQHDGEIKIAWQGYSITHPVSLALASVMVQSTPMPSQPVAAIASRWELQPLQNNTTPGIKYLYSLRTAFDLRIEVIDHSICQFVE